MALVNAEADVSGDAITAVSLTKVYQLAGGALVGDASISTGVPESLAGVAMVADASVAAAAQNSFEVGSEAEGQAAVAAPAELLVAVGTDITGDGSVAADGDGAYSAVADPSGDAVTSFRALEDDEIAGDVVAGSATAALGGLVAAGASEVTGEGVIDPNAIVRPRFLPQKLPASDVTSTRMVGLQPGRESPDPAGKTRLVTDPDKLREANRKATRIIEPVRKDSGVSEVDR